MCVCDREGKCVFQDGGPCRANTVPKGPLSSPLFNGFKSSFNEYRVKLNGKSITAIKSRRLQSGRFLNVNGLTFVPMGH